VGVGVAVGVAVAVVVGVAVAVVVGVVVGVVVAGGLAVEVEVGEPDADRVTGGVEDPDVHAEMATSANRVRAP
jgi:hypothetical protein